MTNRNRSARFPSLRLGIGLAVSALLMASPKTASAQQWLKDSRVGQGGGIPALGGDLELHPGVGGEVGYDSNYFLRTFHTSTPTRILVNGGAGGVAGAPDEPPEGALVLRLTPSFYLNNRSSTATEGGVPELNPFYFTGGAAATLSGFVGNSDISKQTNVSGTASLRLDINRARPVGFDVFANYTRVVQPTVIGDPDLSFNQSNVGAGGDLVFLPGGGTLDLRLGYQFYGNFFEDSEGVGYSNLTHEISFRDRWKFRPRTALFHDTTLRFVSYPNADRAVNYLNDSTPLRTRFGLTGLITDSFGALAAVGYGATFFKDPAAASSTQYDSIDGQAELTWYLSQNPGTSEPGQATLLLSTIAVGYLRDFQNSLLSNFYTSNKVYAKFNYFFGPKAVIQIGADFSDLEYPTIFYNAAVGGGGGATAPTQAAGAFTDYRLTATAFAEYHLLPSFGINTTLIYDQMFSDTQIPTAALAGGAGAAAGGTQYYDLAWRRFQAFVGARWFL